MSDQSRKERRTEIKRSSSFLGNEALLQVEENLLKRLRESSTKDLLRTEQIVKTELKSQRRELGKRMNEKISELWLAFEEFGSSANLKTGGNDLDEHRGSINRNRSKDSTWKPDVAGLRTSGGNIVRSNCLGGKSSLSNSDIDEDADRGYDEDEDENSERSSSRNHDVPEIPISSASSSKPSIKSNLVNKDSSRNRLADRAKK